MSMSLNLKAKDRRRVGHISSSVLAVHLLCFGRVPPLCWLCIDWGLLRLVHFWLYSGVGGLGKEKKFRQRCCHQVTGTAGSQSPQAQPLERRLEAALQKLGRPERLQCVGGAGTPHGHRKYLP
ncbi:hypothetical protein O6P43_034509 [Quillaja saponaria]|uniref:Uncharacterized protein n=1 Tax=Quillaja saponaria TaxID=32244 RepID=A0AAD7P548_QUISA|nr:hypothetical protein O6P43_034509 [Quillaja saponaria]